jgi:predicted DsbA family dithiol-disulfide isomerase
MHIDIVSDVVCPWCYIGKHRFERALARRPGLAVTRSWRAFRLNPGLPSEGMPQRLYLAAKFGSTAKAGRALAVLAAAGQREGIDFNFDRIRRAPNTLRAHRLIRYAVDEGPDGDIVEALFHAYFHDGLDIGDIHVLTEIGGRVGLDREAVRRYLAGEKGTREVCSEDRRARQLGIHAVPCFVLERGYAISGAQEPEMFLSLIDVAARVGSAPNQTRPGRGDAAGPAT